MPISKADLFTWLTIGVRDIIVIRGGAGHGPEVGLNKTHQAVATRYRLKHARKTIKLLAGKSFIVP